MVARTNVLGAGVAVLSVEGLEAAAAVGPAVLHDVPLPPQHRLAFKAAEVLHVPVPPFGLGAFVGKNDLWWGGEWVGNTNVGQSQVERGPGTRAPTFMSPFCTRQLCPFAQPPNFTGNPPPQRAQRTPVVWLAMRAPFTSQGNPLTCKYFRTPLGHRQQSVKAELAVTCS